MLVRRPLLWFGLLPVVLGSVACLWSGATAPVLETGAYVLTKYDGRALPFDLGPMPPKGAVTDDCHILITGGTLSVYAAQGTFSYTYDIRNGCTHTLMSQPGLQGTYVQHGGDITFTVTAADGVVTRYDGFVSNTRVVFKSVDEVLEFAR